MQPSGRDKLAATSFARGIANKKPLTQSKGDIEFNGQLSYVEAVMSSFFRSSALLLLVVAVFCAGPLLAQFQGGHPPATPAPPTAPTPSEIPTVDQRMPMMFSGKVIMEDGSAPPEPVQIIRTCNGESHPEVYTNLKGLFSFQIGQNTGVFTAETKNATSSMDLGSTLPDLRGMSGTPTVITMQDLKPLNNCEIKAQLFGFRSSVIQLAGRGALEKSDIGIIVLSRIAGVTGTGISDTSRQAPKNALKALTKAKEAGSKKDFVTAQAEAEKAVKIYPKYASAWNYLGLLMQQQNKPEEAKKAFMESIAADPTYVSPYVSAALIATREAKWEDVIKLTDKAIALNPQDFPTAYFYNAVANYSTNKLDAASAIALKGISIDAQHSAPRLHLLVGSILDKKGNYAGAIEQLNNYLQYAPTAPDVPTVKSRLAELQKLVVAKTPTAETK